MLKFLARFPRFNGFLLGVLQGVPQGMVLPNQDQLILSALSVFDENLVFVVCFGFFMPLVFFSLVVAIRGARRSKWWVGLSRYVHLYDMMFWACLSFAAGGLYALNQSGIGVGYGMCAFFAASGVGFLIAGFLETRLQNKNSTKDF
jgi:Na+/H+-dicarboxylate symporter